MSRTVLTRVTLAIGLDTITKDDSNKFSWKGEI